MVQLGYLEAMTMQLLCQKVFGYDYNLESHSIYSYFFNFGKPGNIPHIRSDSPQVCGLYTWVTTDPMRSRLGATRHTCEQAASVHLHAYVCAYAYMQVHVCACPHVFVALSFRFAWTSGAAAYTFVAFLMLIEPLLNLAIASLRNKPIQIFLFLQ